MHLTGYPDGPPVRAGAGGLGVAFTDAAGAFFGTYSILAALEYRERTGMGQWLDLSHYEAGAATIPEALLDFSLNRYDQGRRANRHPWRAPQGCYPCAGRDGPMQDDAWVAISVASDAGFRALAEQMGMPALSHDERFATMTARRRHHDALDELISSWTMQRLAVSIERDLQAHGVEAVAVATPRDVWFDPQLRHRGFFETVLAPASAPEIGSRPHLRPGWRMSSTPAATRRLAPLFGEHTREVLISCLGLNEAACDTLEAEGVIAREPAPGIIARPGPMDLPVLLRSQRLREADPDYRRKLAEAGGAANHGEPATGDAVL